MTNINTVIITNSIKDIDIDVINRNWKIPKLAIFILLLEVFPNYSQVINDKNKDKIK